MSSTGGTATVWRQRSTDLSWREIDDEVIILDLKTATYLRLNSTGRVLWNLLGHGASEEELAAALQEAFGLRPEKAAHDVHGFLASCQANGLVEATPAD